jgi:hypothetical protein
VDTAVARGRGILYDEYPDSRGFATPVLFFRSDTGRLWKSEDEAKAEAEKKVAESKPTSVTNIGNQTNVTEGGITMGAGASIQASGNVSARDNIATSGGQVIQAGAGSTVTVGADPLAYANFLKEITDWETRMKEKVGALSNLSEEDRKELKQKLSQVKMEAIKGQQADPGRLEKLVNTLGALAPDMFEVAVTTLASPLGGIGLALKKIGEKAKVERSS